MIKLKNILLEARDCPAGYEYDATVDNCVKVLNVSLAQKDVMKFKDDPGGLKKDAFDRYIVKFAELRSLYKQNGETLDKKFDHNTYKKPKDPIDFYTKLYNLTNAEYKVAHNTLESIRRQRFIDQQVRPTLGTPYVWGGRGPDMVDCSGLVCSVFELPTGNTAQTLYDQSNLFTDINKVKPGDLIFFDNELNNPEKDKDGRPIDHVGIVSSVNGSKIKMIHARGGKKCSKKKYEAGKLPPNCEVQETRYGNFWKKRTKAFGKLKDYKF